ncbi:hypothetical protein SH139x_000246 [Planctomycetaceae bacterium SH139]
MKLTSCRALLSVALLSVLLVTPCFAQGGRGGRGGGGFGGGMGMMGGGGGDMMLLGLLRVEAVQKEIDMSTDQIEAIGKVSESATEGVERPDFRAMRDASEAEREKMMEKMRKQSEEIGKKVTEQLEEVLFPEQLDRARQIALQQQGVGAFNNADVIKKLEITDDQTEKMSDIRRKQGEEMRTQMQELFRAGDRDAIGKKMREMQEQQMKNMKAVLTEKQTKTFAEMLGEPFEMPAGAMGGGFGRGGRGGGEAGGRGGRAGGAAGGRGGRGGREAGGRGDRDPGNDA